MTYEEVKEFLDKNLGELILIDFREYGDTSNTKVPILDIQNYEVITSIPENEFIDEEVVDIYYGEGSWEARWDRLCRYPYIRLVISKPTSSISADREYKVLHLVKPSFTTGHQEIDLKIQRHEQLSGGAIPWTQR